MSDYERIARLIQFLEDNQETQPNLDQMATYIGLSPHHLHRLFANWAGITPKGFLQCLTAERAKHLLKKGKSVLDTSLEVGLSGPSRLHDLCVTIESASPGEIKSGGVGWTIRHGVAESPLGRMFVAESPRGICRLAFLDSEEAEGEERARLRAEWPGAELVDDPSMATRVLGTIFETSKATKKRSPLKALVRGTEFQVLVWKALIQIQSGELVSYGQLASHIGKLGASRAVGTAVGRNELAYLIPCHRVIRETGVVGNYRWGRTRKQALLAWESG